MRYDTKILHIAGGKDPATGALSTPIYPASTYAQHDIDTRQEFDYSRSGNPTRHELEKVLAGLENADAGFAFASGVAAIFAALSAVLKAGDHIVATENVYGGTYRMLTSYFTRYNVTCTFADTRDLEKTEKAIQPNTKVLLLESPSNPLQHIIDFEAMAALAHKHNLISMVDNTFLSPYFFQPLEWGIDVSIHSATKFLGGHSDLLAGTVMTGTKELSRAVYTIQNSLGGVLSPENSWLLLRGIKTLGVRMKAQQEGAFILARWLKKQSWVTDVFFPGLEDHPGHSIIKKQAKGFGAVVSFQTDTDERAKRLLKHVKIAAPAVSLGGVESILSYPARMSHAAVPKEEREKIGITDRLLRLSVGLEDPEDLIEDLEQAAIHK